MRHSVPLMPPVFGCHIIKSYPHDPAAFTQGLCWIDGALFESTGLVGRSTVREVRLRDGEVLRSAAVPDHLFGEGLTAWGDELVTLTWQGGAAFVGIAIPSP